MAPKDSGMVTRFALPDHISPKADLDGTQLMTGDYITGMEGYYMPSESFLYLRKYELMIEKPPHTHPPTGPHHNPHKHPTVALVPGAHKYTNPGH